ncbi:hypothetical protein [Halalkalibaculum sp. DA384]|uniref:hypothetical protein n=1 Tax=Halalkalibaculum sp. DA384 TaxID=3373606 RepID=UPI00375443B6
MKTSGLLGALLLVWASTTFAQSALTEKGEISGRVYSDYFWVASNHNNDLEGKNGFWIRRVYFTYDYQISEAFSGRFRLEGNSPGQFNTEAKITPVVKDLYLQWENDQHQILAGISPTPTFALVEDVWGYRSVEKSPLDLLKFASSRDFGIAFEGELDTDGRLNYHFMVGNGNSNSSETNPGKKFMLSLSYELTDHLVAEVYGDYNDQFENQDWFTLQGFLGYQSDSFNLGLLFAHQQRQNATQYSAGNEVDLSLEVASVFSNFTLSEKMQGFLRVDRTFDNINGVQNNDYFPISSQSASTILIAGLDFELDNNIHLMPNLEAAIYDESDLTGTTPGTDLIPRLTLAYNF